MSRAEKRAIFAIGAAGYPLLEMLYRKRTHWSMALAGGVCFSFMYHIHQTKRSLVRRGILSAIAISGVELMTGLVVNRVLNLDVWDYSGKRFNILGQVCPTYAAIWFGLSTLLAPVCRGLGMYFSRRA